MSKPVCIIPARMGSKRLPRKNVIMCDGKPLIWYTIQAAKDSGVFDDIVVTTDDYVAFSIACEMDVLAMDRADELLVSDTATVVDVCKDAIHRLGSLHDTFCVLLPTCPLRTADDIRKAREFFVSCDFVMSVVEYSYPVFHALSYVYPFVEPISPVINEQSQNIRTAYHHNGAVICGHTESLRKYKSFYGGKVVPYFMPRERSVDIDTLDDLEYAEYLLKKRRGAV